MALRRAARLNVQANDPDDDDNIIHGPAPQPVAAGGDDEEGEPEGEPDDEADAPDGAERAEKSTRVDLRNIKTQPFDGAVAPGQFDAKASDWWLEFSEQVEDAQLLAGQAWPEPVKKAVLMQFLTGMARRWYREWRRNSPNETFERCGQALVREFRPNLLHADIADKLRTERKRWDETYREYADRLMQMADALEGGSRLASNARQALVSFARNAYPRYTDFVESKVDLRADDPARQLATAVAVLSDKAGTDGRGAEKRKPVAPSSNAGSNKKPAQQKFQKKKQNSKNDKNDKKNEKKRPAEANAAVIERKRAKTAHGTGNRDGKKSIVCYECGQNGHTAAYCRKFLQGQGMKDQPASANQAEVEDASSEEDDE